MKTLIAATPAPLVAALSATALLLLTTSALRLSSAGRTDPSDEARSVTLALYGCVVAVVTLGLFIAVM
ncbi:hypothetical protein ACFYT4_07585 [Streptomyces sp. NPDC004609]|uniref:hypothetical protein n=1 Tax=Streptomyces sp. NPDC004609 TaxID=3364704 RepID=UPI00367F451C